MLPLHSTRMINYTASTNYRAKIGYSRSQQLLNAMGVIVPLRIKSYDCSIASTVTHQHQFRSRFGCVHNLNGNTCSTSVYHGPSPLMVHLMAHYVPYPQCKPFNSNSPTNKRLLRNHNSFWLFDLAYLLGFCQFTLGHNLLQGIFDTRSVNP